MAVALAFTAMRPVGFLLLLALLPTMTSSQSTTDCGAAYTTATGSFAAPANSGGCVWTITSPDAQKAIRFNVSNMYFERKYCRNTYLEVRDGLTEQGNRLAGFCGGPPQSVLSNRNSLYIRLRSSTSQYVPRFTASWSTVCHRNLTSPTGTIQFGGTSDCTFVIDQPRGYTIDLNFTSISCSESIEVYDGASTTFPQVAKTSFCGSSPGRVRSTGNALFIKFQTSSGTNGFTAVYARVAPTCPQQRALGDAGTIQSPGFPEPYPGQGSCTWTLTVPTRHVVDFTFHVIALGDRTNPFLDCSSTAVGEILSLHKEQNGNQELLERICYRTPSSQTFKTAYDHNDYTLTVNFTSRVSQTNRNYLAYGVYGFNISYVMKEIPDCTSSPISGGSQTNDGSGLCYDTTEREFVTGSTQPFLVFGNFFKEDDAYSNVTFPSRTLPVEIPGGIPIGNRNFKYVHIHEDGELSFSNDGRPFYARSYRYYDYFHQQSSCSNTRPSLCAFCTWTITRPSAGMGGIFYKVHKSEDSNSKEKIFDPFNMLASRFKRPDTFNASLVLVVTWDRVKGQIVGNAAATFQVAIGISKDEAFALVSYKDMSWQGSRPQIFYSPDPNDGSQCQQLLYSGTQSSLAIDQRLGNTGFKGSWLYKLGERTASLTSQCNDWQRRNIGRNATRWSRFNRLPQCPCVDEKRAMYNGAYGIWIRAGFRWNAANTYEMYCYRLSRSATAEKRLYPYGKECCYDGNTLVSSRLDAATATAYNPSYPVLRERYLKEDKFGYDVCCRNESAEDCNKYYDLRPIGTCDQDPPFKFAWLCCDPYFLTLDEEEYLFNGWGEYTLVNLTSGSRSFTLQARTDLAETDTGTLTNATIFSAFGARENNVRVFVQLDPNTKAALVIYVNDSDYSRRFQNDVDFILDEDDLLLQRRNDTVQIAFQSGISFGVSLRTKSLGISVNVPKTYQNKTRGLLGNFNGIKEDDFLLPNGTVLPSTLSERQIFDVFGPAWAVTANNSVMRYGPREGPSDYSHPEFVPIFMDEQTEEIRNASRALCGRNLACLYDYIATAQESIAMESKAFKENADGFNEALKNAVPAIDPPSVMRANSGDRVTFNLRGSDLDGDPLTYYNATYNSGVQLDSVTGDVSFVASSNTPVDLHFYVEDSKMSQSPIQAVQVVLCSGCNGHGDCSPTAFQPSLDTSYYFQRAACVCYPAWDGEDCELDRDGCAFSPCLPGQSCTDLRPQQQGSSFIGFSCGPCPTGYSPLNGSANDCVDVDECLDSAVHGCSMTCTNTPGSYQCGCSSGYRLASDGRSCQDVDECEERTDDCEQNCHNDAGGFQCSCEQGYVLQSDGSTCRQNATLDTACRYAGCSQGCRLATDPPTGLDILQCFCFAGYDQDPQDDAACLDHDECRLDNVTCSHNCYNYDGGFACTCNSGYRLAADQVTCRPCPPLTYGPNCQYTCDCNGRGQRCDPATGCVCDGGWTGVGCQEDVDECTETPDICGAQLQCVNTLGSYSCRCRDGFSQDSSGVCTDIDECEEDSLLNTCDSLQRCVNFPGGFTCECLPGYITSGGGCIDVDECSANISECQQQCSNTGGSYNCDCYYGYRLNADRTTCTQVTNRCAAGGISCDQGCSVDEEDNPFCFCNLGYSLNADGQTCDRILTCANYGCSHTCSETDTSLLCSCPTAMTLDNDLKTCKVLPGLETCVQFEARTPCPGGQFCVLVQAGPVCRSNQTGTGTGDGQGGNDETGGSDETSESSADALLIGLSVGIPLAVIVIVAVVVIVIIHVIKPGRKRKEPVEDPYAHLSDEKEAESMYTELQNTNFKGSDEP